jgi:hypothetical protein
LFITAGNLKKKEKEKKTFVAHKIRRTDLPSFYISKRKRKNYRSCGIADKEGETNISCNNKCNEKPRHYTTQEEEKKTLCYVKRFT